MKYQPALPPVLSRVDLSIHLPTLDNERMWGLEVIGRCTTKRASLWSRQLSWHQSEVDHGLQVCDEVNFLLHAVLQDRPVSPFWLDRAIRGLPGGVQLELPLE